MHILDTIDVCLVIFLSAGNFPWGIILPQVQGQQTVCATSQQKSIMNLRMLLPPHHAKVSGYKLQKATMEREHCTWLVWRTPLPVWDTGSIPITKCSASFRTKKMFLCILNIMNVKDSLGLQSYTHLPGGLNWHAQTTLWAPNIRLQSYASFPRLWISVGLPYRVASLGGCGPHQMMPTGGHHYWPKFLKTWYFRIIPPCYISIDA